MEAETNVSAAKANVAASRAKTVRRWSQAVFWFSASSCLLIVSSGFAWRVWRGKPASIEWGNLRITSEQAETFVAGARDRLLMVRTSLNDAAYSNDADLLGRTLPELDEVLKSLGVAETALKKQQKALERYVYDEQLDFSGYSYGSSGWYEYTPTPPPSKRPAKTASTPSQQPTSARSP